MVLKRCDFKLKTPVLMKLNNNEVNSSMQCCFKLNSLYTVEAWLQQKRCGLNNYAIKKRWSVQHRNQKGCVFRRKCVVLGEDVWLQLKRSGCNKKEVWLQNTIATHCRPKASIFRQTKYKVSLLQSPFVIPKDTLF